MRLFTPLLLLAATVVPSLAKPLPLTMDEIQRRWSQGESEASIHAKHNARDATPAWPVVRSYMEGKNFAYATDERTMEMRRARRQQKRAEPSASLMERMKAFVEKFYRSQGETSVVGKREAEVEEAPVLKPRGPYRYQFNA